MIELDSGRLLLRLLTRAAYRACKGVRVDVATPFFDPESPPAQLLKAIAASGARVRLFTKAAEDQHKQKVLDQLSQSGVRVIPVRPLHAKAVLWVGKSHDDVMGYLGSHNFTNSSAKWAFELGVFFSGRGAVEALLLRDLCSAFEGWERAARQARAA